MAARWRFWMLALLWLPGGILATSVVRFGLFSGPVTGPGTGPAGLAMIAASLLPVAPCGIPLALGCRRLLHLGYPRTAWASTAVVGPMTVVAALFAGLLGPIAIAVYAIALSLPVWALTWWLARRE